MRLDHSYLDVKLEVLKAEFDKFQIQYKRNYYEDMFDECGDSSQKKINVFLGKSKGKKLTISLRRDRSVSKENLVASFFNEFFAKVGEDLTNSVSN